MRMRKFVSIRILCSLTKFCKCLVVSGSVTINWFGAGLKVEMFSISAALFTVGIRLTDTSGNQMTTVLLNETGENVNKSKL